MNFIGLDAGSVSVKLVVLDEKGESFTVATKDIKGFLFLLLLNC